MIYNNNPARFATDPARHATAILPRLQCALLRRGLPPPPSRRTCPVLDSLDQRDQTVPLEWERQVGERRALQGRSERSRIPGRGTVQQQRAALHERQMQHRLLGKCEYSLDDRDQRRLHTACFHDFTYGRREEGGVASRSE